jgi:hypothetical protein
MLLPAGRSKVQPRAHIALHMRLRELGAQQVGGLPARTMAWYHHIGPYGHQHIDRAQDDRLEQAAREVQPPTKAWTVSTPVRRWTWPQDVDGEPVLATRG